MARYSVAIACLGCGAAFKPGERARCNACKQKKLNEYYALFGGRRAYEKIKQVGRFRKITPETDPELFEPIVRTPRRIEVLERMAMGGS